MLIVYLVILLFGVMEGLLINDDLHTPPALASDP